MCPVLDQIRNLTAVLDDLPESDKDMIFRRTAARVYGISDASGLDTQARDAGSGASRAIRSAEPIR
jgi:hypothetical protein